MVAGDETGVVLLTLREHAVKAAFGGLPKVGSLVRLQNGKVNPKPESNPNLNPKP